MDNPRNYVNLGRMACINDANELGDSEYKGRFNSLYEIDRWIRTTIKDKMIIMPLFIYTVNNVTRISCEKPANIKSEQVGYIFTTFKGIRNACKAGYMKIVTKTTGQRISRKQVDYAIALVREEVKEYDKYLSCACKVVA